MKVTIQPQFKSARIALLLLLPLVPGPASKAQDARNLRDVSGTVTDPHREPLKGAVVQLENESTSAVTTYVTGADGHFEFKRVSANDDFRIFATFHGRRSHHKELSKFSSKTSAVVRLIVRSR